MASEESPATRRDLAELEERLTDRFSGQLLQTKTEMQDQIRAMQTDLQDQMRAMQAELQEQMRDMQTELLKAFIPWQEAVHMQFGELDLNTTNSVNAVKERMKILERRLLQIERKLLLEPPAA